MAAGPIGEGKPFQSARNEYEYDCARPRQRMLATTGFSGRMGQGDVVATRDGSLPWAQVGTSGPAFEHWKLACTKR